jgi:hypothetical protein
MDTNAKSNKNIHLKNGYVLKTMGDRNKLQAYLVI